MDVFTYYMYLHTYVHIHTYVLMYTHYALISNYIYVELFKKYITNELKGKQMMNLSLECDKLNKCKDISCNVFIQ